MQYSSLAIHQTDRAKSSVVSWSSFEQAVGNFNTSLLKASRTLRPDPGSMKLAHCRVVAVSGALLERKQIVHRDRIAVDAGDFGNLHYLASSPFHAHRLHDDVNRRRDQPVD